MKKLYFSSDSGKIVKTAVLAVVLLFSVYGGQAQPYTFHPHSFIINMGIVPQTIANGLKPYGLIYDLIRNYDVPVYWIINPTKAKDGIDFTYNGVDYKGGTFIIPDDYITSAVSTKIGTWTAAGVVGAYTTTDLTLTPAYRFTSVPTWTLDAQNGGIAQGFLTNAGINLTSFPGAYNWLTPSALGVCNDIFVMPHADPTWATHGNLYNWNLTYKGSIWLGCHAGSALANMYNPADTSQQCNFLMRKTNVAGTGIILPVSGSTSYSQNSLVLWGNHTVGSIPYNTLTGTVPNGTLASAQDPVAQYMGVSDLAHLNGSEQIYLPVLNKGWFSTTKIICYDPTQANVPALSPGTAVIIAYGRGFGDTNRGYVMYEAGHSINKGTAGDVPAQRAFFNWSFLSTLEKVPVINSITGILPSYNAQPYPQTYPLSISYSSPVSSGFISVTWICRKASDGTSIGTFTPNGTLASASTTFTPPNTLTDIPVIISVRIVDVCGRSAFDSYQVTLKACNVSATPTVTNPGCFGSSDGSVALSFSGGSTPYNWTWTRTNPAGGPVSGTGSPVSGLSAGTYTIGVTDATGCSTTVTTLLTQPNQLVASTAVTPVLCYGGNTGAIDLTVTGGTPPYNTDWSDLSGTGNPEDRTSLAAGTYSVTVTDSKGCQTTPAVTMATVTQTGSGLSVPGVVTNVTCYGLSTGAINITASGGTSPYTYNWGGGVTTEDRTGLAAGTYNVSVTDANGCTATNSFTVTQPALLTLSTAVTQPSCPPGAQQNGSNGAINLTVGGGTAAFAFAWTGPSGYTANTEDISGLIAGTFAVTVTDSKGCTKSITVTLNNLNPNPVQPASITH